MTTTARKLITRALKKLGVIGQGQTVSANDASDALDVLNSLVDGWKVDNLTVYAIVRTLFALTNGQAVYTLGTGGNFNTERPTYFDGLKISIITNINPSLPLELPLEVLDTLQWQNTPTKNVPGALPTRAYITRSFPLAQIQFWPVPTVATLETALYLPTRLSVFSGLDVQYDIPPAYNRALEFCLAVDLAPDFAVSLEDIPTVMNGAQQYLGDIRRANIMPEEVPCDAAIVRPGRGFNYYTGEVK